jgi:hypothetical protein
VHTQHLHTTQMHECTLPCHRGDNLAWEMGHYLLLEGQRVENRHWGAGVPGKLDCLMLKNSRDYPKLK